MKKMRKTEEARWEWIIEQSAVLELRDKWRSEKSSVMLRRGPGPLFDGEKRKQRKRSGGRLWGGEIDGSRARDSETDRGERYGWQAAITETEAPCEHSQVWVCVWQYVRRGEAQAEWRQGGRWGGEDWDLCLPGPLLTLIQADHRLIMSALFVEILPHQMANLLHVYLYQIREERQRSCERGRRCTREREGVCTCLSLSQRHHRGANYLLLREQLCHLRPFILPPPQKHLSLNMQWVSNKKANIYQHQNLSVLSLVASWMSPVLLGSSPPPAVRLLALLLTPRLAALLLPFPVRPPLIILPFPFFLPSLLRLN